MSDPTTTNVLLAVPTHGSDVDTWDVPVNANSAALDGFIGGSVTIGVSSGVFTLTAPAGVVTPASGPTQAQNATLRFTGSIINFVGVILPLPGRYIIDNQCTGAGVLTFSSATVPSQIICAPPGKTTIHNSGSEVDFVDLQGVGSYLDFATATVPGWISRSTKPPFLLCDGSAFSAVTYPALATFLGTTTLPDFRGRSGHYLNAGTGRLTAAGAGIDGNTLFATGGVNGVTLAANQIPSLTSANASQSITVASAHTYPDVNTFVDAVNNGTSTAVLFWRPSVNAGVAAISSSGLNSITVNYVNSSLQLVGNADPGIVSGIRLIRAI